MRPRLSIIRGLLAVFALALLAGGCAPKHSEVVVAEYGTEVVTLPEFEKAFDKNTGGFRDETVDSLTQLKDFLDLYVNFLMKVRTAKVRGYDENPTLQQEFDDYKRTIASTYFIEKKLIEPALEEIYNRRKTSYRVAHIMFRPSGAGGFPEAKQRADSVFALLQQGGDFEQLAKENSEDQYSAEYGGEIRTYFTSGDIVPEFEDAFYTLEPGEVYPEPVKTDFGYHIIKTLDKKERIPAVEASHILISLQPDQSGAADTAAALATIDTVLQKLEAGEDFAELAKQYSEDPGSGEKGGELGYIERRQVVAPFADAAFSLSPGEYSAPVKTRFGYHIIKVTDIKDRPTFEEAKEQVRKIFEEQRYNKELVAFQDSLRSSLGYTKNQEVFSELISLSQDIETVTDYLEADWRSEIGGETIFTVGDTAIDTDSLVARASMKSEYGGAFFKPEVLDRAIEDISGDVAVDVVAYGLDSTDAEFHSMMENYKRGIYIFKLQEDEVWDKIELDSLSLNTYWEENKEEYQLGERVSFEEIYSRTDSVASVLYEKLKQGVPFDSLRNANYRPSTKTAMGVYDSVEVEATLLARKAAEMQREGNFTAPFKSEGGWSIVMLRDKHPARMMTFTEARPLLLGDYQEMEAERLEKEFLNQLHSIYKPKKYYDELENAYRTE